MFGSDAFGATPFSGDGAPVFDYDAMLDSSREELVYTVALTVWNMDDDVEETVYLASSEWATSPTDVPASVPFDGRLTTVLSFRRSVVDSARLGINFTSGDGTIAFANPDGAYDDYFDDYAVDGREVIVRVGRKTDSFADHLIIFRGVVIDWSIAADEVTVTVRDEGFRLDIPASPNLYAGTGGKEGANDVEGKRKPLTFGFTFGTPAVPVDISEMIFQVHDADAVEMNVGSIEMYDRGVELTRDSTVDTYDDVVSATPASGHFVHSRDGYLKLGATPAGTIFGKVASRMPGADPSDYPSVVDIIRAVLDGVTDLEDHEIDHASLDQVDALNDDEVSIHISPEETMSVADLFSRLIAGIGGWVGFSRQGLLSVGRFDGLTSGEAIVAHFSEADGDIIALDVERMPSGVWPPPWRWRVAWGRNFTVFTDFAASVSAGIRDYYAEPYRLAEQSSASVQTDHPLAVDPPPVESYLRGASASLSEAGRLLSLYRNNRRLYRLTLGRQALRLNLGDAIHVTYPRLGLSNGKRMRVAEIEDRIDLADGSPVEQITVLAFALE